jgi:N utilization substance protein B
MKTARRQSREIALQALYAWQLSGGDPMDEARGLEGFEQGDRAFAEALVRGVRDRVAELKGLIVPHLDRDFARLSPVERSILYIGTFELVAHPETPFKVVVNEAIELGKSFGGSQGHRFVNGVLEKIAAGLRPDEVTRARNPA